MESAILLGNGLNKCYDSSIDWGRLLEDLANEYNVSFNWNDPFPLEFEAIMNQILAKGMAPSEEMYRKIKEELAEKIKLQRPQLNSIHETYVLSPYVDHFLTTNYDYMLERVLDPAFEGTSGSEKKYSLHRSAVLGSKHFYHIHGEARYPTTLCLGYEHYVGYLARMRDYAKQFIVPEQPAVNKKKEESWLELFFTHDIYIVGLSLAPAEIDLWWLLTYRAWLYYSNQHKWHDRMKNKIVFYDLNSDTRNEQKDLFKNMHVEFCEIKVRSRDYLTAYQDIYDDIIDKIRSRKAAEAMNEAFNY